MDSSTWTRPSRWCRLLSMFPGEMDQIGSNVGGRTEECPSVSTMTELTCRMEAGTAVTSSLKFTEWVTHLYFGILFLGRLNSGNAMVNDGQRVESRAEN